MAKKVKLVEVENFEKQDETMVLIPLTDLRKLVQDNVEEAKLELLDQVKPYLSKGTFERKIAKIKGIDSTERIILGTKKKDANATVRLVVLEEEPEVLAQFMARKL